MTVTVADGTAIGWSEEGAGRPLLLVHGGVADASAWASVQPLLPKMSGWSRWIGAVVVVAAE